MSLLVQLLVSTALIVAVTLIHGTGVVLSARIFRCEEGTLREQRLAVREFTVMVPMALWLFALHTTEIALYAAFYLIVGEAETLERALHISGMAYTTLGVAEGQVNEWPLVATFEGLAGFLLIGWSAAVFVTDMDKVLRRRD